MNSLLLISPDRGEALNQLFLVIGNINSGSIGINITHSQDTASALVPTPINCRDTALPCPLYHSDATGNNIIGNWKFLSASC
jgi:hypothetical protein